MIRYVKLHNYKSLVDLEANFTKTKTKAKNLILIYGENGVGKSNFANSFYTLYETIITMSSIKIWKGLIEKYNLKSTNYDNYFENNFKLEFKDIEMIIKNYKTIGSKDNMILEFGFICNGKNGIYHIEMNDNEIVCERLEYILNKYHVCFFDITPKVIKINTNIFNDKEYYNEFKKLLKQYWGKHSFMSILLSEIYDKKDGYTKKKISNNLYDLLYYFLTINTKIKEKNNNESSFVSSKNEIMYEMSFGKISIDKEKLLDKVELVLNDFLTSLYSDIKKVYYKKEYKDGFITYNLIVSKLIYGKMIDVDFELESTGTQNILDILPYLISACEGKVVVIDELDTGIHDLIVSGILENVSKYIKGQLIITTHNTMLIESSIPNENIYVFNVNNKAEKELIAITDFNGRIHKNINPRKKYLGGVYGGIPIISDIDFDEIIDYLD